MPKFHLKSRDGGPGSGPRPGGSRTTAQAKTHAALTAKGHVHSGEADGHHYYSHPRTGERSSVDPEGRATKTREAGLKIPKHRQTPFTRTKDSRSGKNALAGDSKEVLMPRFNLSPVATVAKGALMVYLGPRMAADAAIDLHSTLKGVKGKNFRAEAKRVAVDVKKALKGKLAQDADVDDISDILEEIAEALESEGAVPTEGEEDDFVENDAETFSGMTGEGSDNGDVPSVIMKIKEFLDGKISPEDQQELDRLIGEASPGGEETPGEDEETDEARMEREAREKEEEERRNAGGDTRRARDRRGARDNTGGAADEPPPFKGRPNPGGTMDKKAMDAAIGSAVARATQNQKDIAAAERFVRPWVGDFAMDSAENPEAVYGQALKMLNVDIKDVHPSAFQAILKVTPKPGSRHQGNGGRFAMDSGGGGEKAKSFRESFPSAARIGRV